MEGKASIARCSTGICETYCSLTDESRDHSRVSEKSPAQGIGGTLTREKDNKIRKGWGCFA